MNSLKALDIISKIELTHMECESDDYYDDDYYYEMDDGTIEENYSTEIKALKKDIRVLSILKRILPIERVCGYKEDGTKIKPHDELSMEFKELTTEAEWKEITRWLNEK